MAATGLSSVFLGPRAQAAASTDTTVTLDVDDTSDAIFYDSGWHPYTGVAGRSNGTADIYVDGTKVTTADTYSPSLVNDVVVFDTGEMPAGSHTLKVVTHGLAGPVGGGPTVEVDKRDPGRRQRLVGHQLSC